MGWLCPRCRTENSFSHRECLACGENTSRVYRARERVVSLWMYVYQHFDDNFKPWSQRFQPPGLLQRCYENNEKVKKTMAFVAAMLILFVCVSGGIVLYGSLAKWTPDGFNVKINRVMDSTRVSQCMDDIVDNRRIYLDRNIKRIGSIISGNIIWSGKDSDAAYADRNGEGVTWKERLACFERSKTRLWECIRKVNPVTISLTDIRMIWQRRWAAYSGNIRLAEISLYSRKLDLPSLWKSFLSLMFP